MQLFFNFYRLRFLLMNFDKSTFDKSGPSERTVFVLNRTVLDLSLLTLLLLDGVGKGVVVVVVVVVEVVEFCCVFVDFNVLSTRTGCK